MRNNVIVIIIACLLLSNCLNAQTIGVYGAANLNTTRESSVYNISSEALAPAISFSLGGYYQFSHTGKIGFMSILNYNRLSNKNHEIPILVESGEQLNAMEAHVNNHYVSLSGLGVMYFGDLYAGIGLTGSILLFSNTKMGTFDTQYSNSFTEEIKEQLNKAKFANKYYAPFTVSVPFLMGYNINRLDILARLNVGLTNRLKGDTFVKEFNNTIEIGIGYRLSNL